MSAAALTRYAWPLSRLAEAVETLAAACKLPLQPAEPPGSCTRLWVPSASDEAS